MAIKLADTLAPMADFPAAMAEHIEFDDGKSLQEKYDLGELGGEGGAGHIELTQAEYDALSDEEKNNGAIYFITDAEGGEGGNASINDNDVSLDSTWSSAKIVTEISESYAIFEGVIGDSYYSTTIDEEDITSAPTTLYGGWTLDRVDTNFTEGSILSAYNNATKKRVLSLTEDIRIGEVYADSFSVYDDTMNNGGNPYKVALLWSNGGTGGDDNVTTYTSLAELGLTADATLNDVIATMPKGSSALLGVTEFTNYQTIFPYEEGNDQFGRVYIVKGNDNGRTYAKWFRKDGTKEAIAIMNINDNQITGWQKVGIRTYTTLEELGLDASATLNDVINAMPFSSSALLGVTMFTDYQNIFPYAETNDQYSRVYIVKSDSLSRVYIVWFNKNGSRYAIANVDGNNKVVGWNNILTQKSDPYTCSTYTVLTGTEDLFTLPCGHYASAKADTAYNYPVTDSSNVLAHIYVLGHLNEPANNKGYRIILYFDNKGRMYRINEWWGSFSNGWQEIITKSYVDSKVVTPVLKAAAGSNINTVGTPSVTASTSGNETTFTFNNLKGAAGAKGDTGTRGGTWYSGVGITGTSTNPAVFSTSGVSSAVVGDMYLNTTFQNVYRCTTAGNASTAKWVYVCCIQGAPGVNGTTPTIKASAGSNIGSVGTPSVSASTSGTTTTFTFNYLKGAAGAKGDKGDDGYTKFPSTPGVLSSQGTVCSLSSKQIAVLFCIGSGGGSLSASSYPSGLTFNNSAWSSGTKSISVGTVYTINNNTSSSVDIKAVNNGGAGFLVFGPM